MSVEAFALARDTARTHRYIRPRQIPYGTCLSGVVFNVVSTRSAGRWTHLYGPEGSRAYAFLLGASFVSVHRQEEHLPIIERYKPVILVQSARAAHLYLYPLERPSTQHSSIRITHDGHIK
jgi:hypothetical protein